MIVDFEEYERRLQGALSTLILIHAQLCTVTFLYSFVFPFELD